MAHELGHFLGLWHTVEHNGSLEDPIADTAGCTPARKTSRRRESICPKAAENLMFWSTSKSTLTAGQAKVARRHPSLRALP